MNYSFRIRFKIDPKKTLNTELDEIELPKVVADTPLKLISPRKDKSINDAEELILSQNGYASAAEAQLAGEQSQIVLMLALARKRIGVNFGSRAPKEIGTNAGFILRYPGMSLFEELWGEPRVLENVHGLMVYESEPKPKGEIVKSGVCRL
jgi:hypothetical protein